MLKIMQIDFLKSLNLFIRAFYVLFLIFPLLLLETIFKSTGLNTFVSIALPIVVAISGALLFVAIFKLYHHYIFKNPEYLREVVVHKILNLVVSKIVLASLWLTTFLTICTICIKVHSLVDTSLAGLSSGALQDPTTILIAAMGSGLAGWFSVATILIQGVSAIPLLYLACTISHLRPFDSYKALAGIFFLVTLFAVENQMISYGRIISINFLGGIEKFLSMELIKSLSVFFAIEVLLTAIFIAINVYFTCVLLRKSDELPGKVEGMQIPIKGVL